MSIRLLLVWLLAVALPVQGVSAATMQFCGHAAAPVHAAGHDHHAHADGGGAQKPAADPGAHKCSACAACCMATALPPGGAPLAAPQPDVPTAQPVPSLYADPDASALERPPRPRLA